MAEKQTRNTQSIMEISADNKGQSRSKTSYQKDDESVTGHAVESLSLMNGVELSTAAPRKLSQLKMLLLAYASS